MYQISYHFLEIRLRFIYIVFSLILTLITSYYYKLEILYIIGRPFLKGDHKFILIELTEAFYTLLRICGILSFFLLVPFCLYHIWSFYVPSRYVFERKILTKILIVFLLLLSLELLILYFIIFPKICEFLLSFEINSSDVSFGPNFQFGTGDKLQNINQLSPNQLDKGSFSILNENVRVHPNVSIELGVIQEFVQRKAPIVLELTARLESYVQLSTRFYLSMLTLLQIPFVIMLFYYFDIIDSYSLCKFRKIFIFSSLLVSAFISPPDILSQSIIAILLFFFYELLIIIGLLYSNGLDFSLRKKENLVLSFPKCLHFGPKSVI